MLPNEILPAMARQKVKNTEIGKIADVLGTMYDGTVIAVRVCEDGDSWIENWISRYCEPVPEEPRPFRVGDAVFVRGTVVPGKDADTYGIYSRISGISKSGEFKIVDRIDWVKNDDVRHATPSECVQYFN